VTQALTPRTRAILLVHPNNPTGSYVKSDEVERLNKLCREHNLGLIADEVFLDYALSGTVRKSFVANRDALTFTLSGLSKIAALPQMKVAWMTASGPEALVRAAVDRLEIIADTYLSLNSPTQWAFPELLAQRRAIQRQLKEKTQATWASLKSRMSGKPCCELLETEGGWYAVLRIAKKISEEDLVIEIMEKTNVLVHPGHFYDFPSGSHLIISLITPEDAFQMGISRILEYLSESGTRA
jgi:alanine-synthesizing transaminase